MISSYIPKLLSNTIEDLVLSSPPAQQGALEEFLAALRANTSLRSVFFFEGINQSSYFYLVLQNLANHTRLTNLRILGPGQPFDLQHLRQLLRNNLQLQLLVLQSCSIGDEEVKSIVEALSGHQRLTSVNLSKNHITAQGSKYLIDFLSSKPSITSIDLSFNHQVDNTAVAHWARLLRQSTSLNNLNLNNNNLGDKAFELLGEALASNAYLKTIGLCDIGGESYGDNDIPTFLQALSANSSLTSLDLSYNKLRQDDIVLLAETLRANKTLTELNLAGTSLDDKDIKVLADGLKFNRTLHVLNLDSNNFAGEGLQSLALFLRTKWCSLKSLSLAEIQDAEINEGIGNLATALRTNTSLIFLKINNDKCDFKQFSALMDALRTNTTLLTLDISNFVSLAQKDEIMLVAESLAANKTLTDINLDTTGINDAGVGLLCSVARDHSSLRHVSLHYNLITEVGAKMLLLTMRLNSKISFEGIVMNPYIDGDFRKEYEEIHHCFKNKKHALTNPHFTPFHFAAKKGIFSAFHYLFGKTENANMTCTYGLSLLDYAGIYGHATVVNLLLNFGAYTRDAILLGVDRAQITSANQAENALFTLDELCNQMDAVLQRPVTTAARLKMVKWHRAGSLLLSLWQRSKLSPGLNEICTRHAAYELGKRLRLNEMLPSLQQRYQLCYDRAGELVVKRYFEGQLAAHVQAGLTPHFAVMLMNKWNNACITSVDLARHFEGAYQGVVFHMWWVNQFPPPFNEAIEARALAAIVGLAQKANEAPLFLRQIMQQANSAAPLGTHGEVIAGAVLTELRTRYRDGKHCHGVTQTEQCHNHVPLGQLSVEDRALFEREVLYPILQSTAGLNDAGRAAAPRCLARDYCRAAATAGTCSPHRDIGPRAGRRCRSNESHAARRARGGVDPRTGPAAHAKGVALQPVHGARVASDAGVHLAAALGARGAAPAQDLPLADRAQRAVLALHQRRGRAGECARDPDPKSGQGARH